MIAENRTLMFTRDDVVDAALTFVNSRRGLLPEGRIVGVDIEGEETPEVVIRLQQPERIFETTVRLSAAQLAAVMIHFCIARQIPIPRKARKEIRYVPEGIQLVITIERGPADRPLVVPHAAA